MKTIIMLIVLLYPCSIFAAIWMQFDRPRTPITKANGTVVSATKRIVYAKKVRDLTFGGEYIEPSLGSIKVIEKYSRDGKLLILLDISVGQATTLSQSTESITVGWIDKIKGRKQKRVSKEKKTLNLQEFKPVILTEKEGVALKTSWGWRPPPPEPVVIESGVTP